LQRTIIKLLKLGKLVRIYLYPLETKENFIYGLILKEYDEKYGLTILDLHNNIVLKNVRNIRLLELI
jgi:hypothetical protein